jgi:hypothetical protein
VTKYGDRIADDHWEQDEPEGPPAWKEDTSAKDITLDVQLHEQGYQNDEKWTVYCTERLDEWRIIAGYAVKHRNKGNYWRNGDRWDDAVDFVDLPLRVRQRVAAVLNRDLEEITPDGRTIHREDGTGLADREDRSVGTDMEDDDD